MAELVTSRQIAGGSLARALGKALHQRARGALDRRRAKELAKEEEPAEAREWRREDRHRLEDSRVPVSSVELVDTVQANVARSWSLKMRCRMEEHQDQGLEATGP